MSARMHACMAAGLGFSPPAIETIIMQDAASLVPNHPAFRVEGIIEQSRLIYRYLLDLPLSSVYLYLELAI
jgi:hypothetical protein